MRFRKEFYALIAVSTMSMMASAVVDPVFPLRIVQLGASDLELGSIVAFASMALLVVRFPIGMISSRIRFRTAASIALLGQFAAIVLYAISPAYSWFAPARTVASLSMALLGINMMVTIASIVPQNEIGRAVATYLASFGISGTLGPLITSLLLTHLPYDQIMMVASALPLIALVTVNAIGDIERYSGDPKESDLDESLMAWVERSVGELLNLARQREMAVAGFLHFLFGLTATFVVTFFTVYAVDELLIPAYVVTLIISSRGLANTLSRLPASYLMDRVSTRKILVVAFTGLAASYLVLSLQGNALLLTVGNLMLGLAWGMRAVVEWTVAESSVPPKTRTISSAYMSFLWDAAGSIGGMVGGFLAVVFSISSVFLFSSILMVAGAAIAWIFGVETKATSSLPVTEPTAMV